MAYRIELVGFRLHADLPLRTVELPYRPGFSALVGVNGAGKTRLLEAVGAALEGRLAPGVVRADLLAQVVPCEEGRDDPLLRIVTSALRTDRGSGESGEAGTDIAQGVRSLVLSSLGPDLRLLEALPEEIRESLMAHALKDPRRPIADEAAAQLLFCLTVDPSGAELWLAGARTGDAAAISTLFEDAFRDWENAAEIVEEFLDYSHEICEAPLSMGPFFDVDLVVDETNYRDPNPFAISSLPQPYLRIDKVVSWPLTARFEPDPDSVQRDTEAAFAVAFRRDSDLVEFGHFPDIEEDPDSDWSSDYRFSPRVDQWCSRFSDAATSAWKELVADATALVVRPRRLGQWITGPAVEWRALDTPTGDWVLLTELSAAQQRWAAFAIAAALTGTTAGSRTDGVPSFLLLDEPERALHRTAESDLGKRLRQLSAQGGLDVIVATHSPRVAAEAHHLMVVRRSAAGVTLARLDADIMQCASDLGLEATDLLGWYRAIVLVEGEHDRVVLEALLGDDLRRLRCRVLQMEGGRNLPGVVESQMLFDFTQAILVPVLDKTRADHISDVWERACQAAETQSVDDAKRLIRETLVDKTSEASWLRQFMSRAIERGRDSRVAPYGLSEDDVVRYISPQHLRPDLPDWETLDARWRSQRPDGEKDIKKWLSRTGVDLSAARVAAAAAKTRPMPEEITGLVPHIEQALDKRS